MEDQKPAQEQRTKKPSLSRLQQLVLDSIPCSEVVFQNTIKSFGASIGGEPETALYAKGGKPSRTANIWMNSAVVIVEQKGKFQIIPIANVRYATPIV